MSRSRPYLPWLLLPHRVGAREEKGMEDERKGLSAQGMGSACSRDYM